MMIKLANMDDVNKVLKILNDAALDLHNKGINQWNYPWDMNVVIDQIKSSYLYTVLVHGQVMGTFGIKNIDHLSDCQIEPGSNYLFQIAIHPDYQGQGYGQAVTEWAYGYARKSHKPLYLDCWAENEKLKSFYQNNGFDYIGDFPEEDYFISVFKHH